MDSEKIRDLHARWAALKHERENFWDPDFRSLAKHFLPRRSRFLEGVDRNTTNRGGLRYDVLDGTAIRARRVASSGMHGGMTSPARPWFRLTLEDRELAKAVAVREWLDEVENRMRALFARSNFYEQIHMFYDELVVFGSDFVFATEDPRSGINFLCLTAGEYCMDTNERGRVDTVFRSMEITARNMIRMFGTAKCSMTVQRAAEKASSYLERFPVVQAILPREPVGGFGLTHQRMPFASFYFEPGEKDKILRESGFRALPGFGARWGVTGQDVYGGSPCMDLLGDVRMLQSLWATYLKQEHKRADPPMASAGGLQGLNQAPGAVNPVQPGSDGTKALYPLYQVTPDPSGILRIVDDVRTSVREGLYNDLFKMLAMTAPEHSRMTATEIAERHEEKLLQLGPVLERLHAEAFVPLVDRVFDIMVENDMVPPPPEILEQMPLRVEFISLLAQAQKMVSTNAVDQYCGFIGANAQIWPDIADALDPDNVADEYAEYLGIPTRMLRSPEARAMLRQQRAEQAQQAQQMEAAQQGSRAIKNIADAGENPALDALLSGVA